MSDASTLIGDRPDTPTTSYRALPSHSTVVTTVAVIVVAAAAWAITIRMAGSMSNMVNGLGQVGRRMPNDMGVGRFLWMWTAMMVAMMAPAVVPATLAHRLVLRRRGEGAVSTAAFVTGFLAVWWLVGLLYLLPFLWFRDLATAAGDSLWLRVVAGGILMLAGGYQFTRRKAHCQGACCAPVGLVLDTDPGNGVTGSLRAGVVHGVHCLGCCWALMTVLLVVGLMNLVWMVALSMLFFVEKHWRRALVVGRVFGVALVVLGLAVMAWPDLLHTVSGASKEAPATMDMPMDMPMP